MTGPILSLPCADNDFHGAYIARVAASFARATGGDLIDEAGLNPAALGRSAWSGNFALLTHRGDAEATLNYGNAFALHLWACNWAQLTAMPSRETAPEDDRALRESFMAQVVAQGFVRGYHGRRISRSGRLFAIRNATVWRMKEEGGEAFGFAAFFRDFDYL